MGIFKEYLKNYQNDNSERINTIFIHDSALLFMSVKLLYGTTYYSCRENVLMVEIQYSFTIKIVNSITINFSLYVKNQNN